MRIFKITSSELKLTLNFDVSQLILVDWWTHCGSDIASEILTLNMLICFNYKICIHILNSILDLARPKYMKLTLE